MLVTILPSLIAIGTLITEILCFSLLRELTTRRDKRVM